MRQTVRRALALLVLATASGCVTASVESRALAPDELNKPRAGETIEGVVYYQPRPYLLIYQFTQFDTSTPRSARLPGAPLDTARCTRAIQKTELQILPDFAHPRVMVAKRHGVGSVRLSVTLADGMVTSVNSEGASTFAEALKAVTGGVADVATVVRGAATARPAPFCNASPVLAMIVPVDWGATPIVPTPDSLVSRSSKTP